MAWPAKSDDLKSSTRFYEKPITIIESLKSRNPKLDYREKLENFESLDINLKIWSKPWGLRAPKGRAGRRRRVTFNFLTFYSITIFDPRSDLSFLFYRSVSHIHQSRKKIVKSLDPHATFLFLTRRKHQIEIVTHILIQIGNRVFARPVIQVDPVKIIIVGIDVIVDVQDKCDDRGNEAHVAQSICTARNR